MAQLYSELLTKAIAKSGLKLDKIVELVGELTGNQPTIHYLSRLKNGKTPPAGDKLNDALAKILNIDPVDLKAAAYREKIPADVLAKLTEYPKSNTA